MEEDGLHQSFLALREYFSGPSQHKNAANPAQLIIFAERAFKDGHGSIASECLELYFTLEPPMNQFMIRAHLCQALALAANSSADSEESLQKAIDCIVTAVNIAKKSECYHFLVHNASVLLWQICRPYRKPGYMRLCVAGWQSVAKAQEHCKEEDSSWRLDILLALLQSQVDAGLKEEAGKTCQSAVQLARKRVPDRLLEVLKLQMLCGLGEVRGLEREMKSVPEFPIFARLYKLKRAMSQQSVSPAELEAELRKLLESTLTMRTGRKTPAASTLPPPTLSPETKAALLLEIAQVCVEQGLVEVCAECVAALPGEVPGARLGLLRHTVASQLSLLQRTAGLPPYSRPAVEAREQTIKQLEECVVAAQRLGDQELVQHTGVVLWGVCLPLLQPNLRGRLSHTLTILTSALEHIDSLLHELRCSLHVELAKVCADQSQLQTALEHINKAQELDTESEWSEQLKWLGERLQLRSQLYLTPPSPLQHAAQILEQVSSSSDSGTQEEMRAVLVKVGTLLAPNCFRVALGDEKMESSERQEKEEKQGRGVDTAGEEGGGREERGSEKVSEDSEYSGIVRLEGKEEGEEEAGEKGKEMWYEVIKDQVQVHKEAIGTDDDADRCRLWEDLARLGRKREVWDVAYVAAKFCLIYDDQRWTVKAEAQTSKTGSKPKLQKASSVSVSRSRSDVSTRTSSSNVLPATTAAEQGRGVGRKRGQQRESRALLRTLAGTHCIHAECAVYQLKEEGHELGHGVPPPSRNQQTDSTAESNSTVVWPGQLSSDAYTSFLRAGELGCRLCEAWLVSNVATYLWNYSHHCLQQQQQQKQQQKAGLLRALVPVFRPLLASVVAVREHTADAIGGDTVCRLCTALAGGLVQTWMPTPPDPSRVQTPAAGGRKSVVKTAGKKKAGGGGEVQLQVSPDAGPELREALEVCERGLGVGGGLALGVRADLLAVWVQCKQLLQQPIPSKTLGVDRETGDPEAAHCKAVVAVEMLSLMGNRIWDFPDCPSLNDAFELVCGCQWSDMLLELELLTRIARPALLQSNYALVSECSSRALQSAVGRKEGVGKKRGRDASVVRRERELLSCMCSLQGQAMVAGGAGNTASARAAMEAFLQSAKYGKDAGSYRRVLEAGQHYWNTCRELTGSALDRELLHQPLIQLLAHLTSFLPRRAHGSTGQVVKMEDLQLQVAMYNIVFQVYADKGDWEEGMKAIEDAMWVTPRTIHRDLAQHKLVFRSKMGRDVEGDMIRFQEVPEEERARLWFIAATNSTSAQLQLKAFRNAIDTLTSSSHTWQKVDYLLEFSEWLYAHQYPVQDALSHLQWGLTLLQQLLQSGIEEGEGGEEDGEKEGGEIVGKEGGETGGEVEGTKDQLQCSSGVRVLEKAVCVCLMMAQLQGRGSEGHRDYCQAALAYCHLIWKGSLESYGQSVSGKSELRLPTSVQEWADFTPTDEFKEYVKSTDCKRSVNKHSISRPTLMCHYLGVLSDELCACELHALALPAETLRLLAAECLVLSRPATQLGHLRLASLCVALGAQPAGEQHRKQAGSVYLNPEDMARSHAEMCERQAKQEMVAREESKRTGSELMRVRPPEMLLPPPLPTSLSPPPVREETVLREVWVEEAALLVKQGEYQISRELLREAKASAQVFADGHTMARALLAQAALATAEKRVEECINLIREAQAYPMSMGTWQEGMLLQLESASSSRAHWEPCAAAVSDAVGSLSSVVQRNRNEGGRVEGAQAVLRARLAALRAEILLEKDERDSEELQHLSEEFSELTASLLRTGREQAAARAMLDHARLTRCSAGSTQDVGHRTHLLQAVELLERAASTLQSVLRNAQSLCPLSDGLSVPVEGVLVEAQLQLAATLLQVYEEHVLEESERRSGQQQKSCIEKMIDDYVQESPKQNSAEPWNNVASVAAEKALAVLTTAYMCSTAQSQPQLRARCAYSIGRAFVVVSQHTSPDSPGQWQERHIGSLTGTAGSEGSEAGGGEVEGEGTAALQQNTHSTLSVVMRREEASKAEIAEASSIQYLAKACQSLGQAVNLALKCGDKELAERAALKMVDTCGSYDPDTTALYLAFYQSCVASRHLSQLLRGVQSDPSESRLAALLQQHSELSRTHSSSPLLAAATAELKTYTCWERLQVSADILDPLRSFPPHFRFLMLQHSENKSQLYSAYLAPPQPPPAALKKGQPPTTTESLEPVISRVSVSSADRECLLQLVSASKRLQAQQLLKSKGATQPSKNVMSLQFRDIVAAMDGYLSSALDPIAAALRKEKDESGLTIILLADFDLLKLPLEALNLLQMDCVNSVARDFSLQMMHHRIHKFLVEEGDSEPSKKKDKFQLQPSFLQANTANFKYILDPRIELKSNDREQPHDKVLSQIRSFPKITSKWSGHSGTENAMSSSQWHPILKQCSGFLFLGTEKLLAHFSPGQLVSLSIPDCSVAIVMDHMQTLGSSLTQSKLDIQKSTEELQTEQCLQAAALLSLVGARSLIARQWHSTPQSCTDTLCNFIRKLLSEGVGIADMRWKEVKDVRQLQLSSSEAQPAEADTTTPEGASISQNVEEPKDLSSVYNSVVYGLPHLALVLPTQ